MTASKTSDKPAPNRKKLVIQNTQGVVIIGGGLPPVIQSMTNTATRDVRSTLEQIHVLARAGCQLVRVAVPTESDAIALPEIVKHSTVPIIADIHFKPELALLAINAGVAKVRINPGTCLQASREMNNLLAALRDTQTPVRIGVNSGSVANEFKNLYNSNPVQALVNSTLSYQTLLQTAGIESMCLSIKSTSVRDTVQAYELLVHQTDYPLHVGITEAGPGVIGVTRNTIALWQLLSRKIGDTFRVSMTGNPLEEIKVAREIINNLSEQQIYPKLVACPTCGRLAYDMERICRLVEDFVIQHQLKPVTIAVMGCEVNGPGECKHAELGITGNHSGKLFVYHKGELIRSNLNETELLAFLETELPEMLGVS